MMRNRILCAAFLLAAACGCIQNDLPYPVVECRIESLSAEGLAAEPVIDAGARTVTLQLPETTDICHVGITGVTLTEGCSSSVPLVGSHDLSSPLRFTLSLYQDYDWTIEARQSISRSFAVEGQVGASEWDLFARRVTAYVAAPDGGFDPNVGPSRVRITDLKLGPEGITRMAAADIPDLNAETLAGLSDFTSYRNVYVTAHGRTETWTLEVKYTDVRVSFRRADGWVRTAWLYAEGLSGDEMGFRYRKTGDDSWTDVPAEDLTIDGGSFSARLHGLEPESGYEAVAMSGEDISPIVPFTTERELPLPNADFETWGTIGSLVCPYLSTDTMFWDTGNKGAATVGATLTESSTDTRPGSPGRFSASLTSKFAGFGGIGKFAAGNLFVGHYYATEGTNGRVNFGRPFTSRPTGLRVWVKFTNGKINRFPGGKESVKVSDRTLTKDDMDEGQVFIALGTWTATEYGGSADSPVQVFSGDESTFFNRNAKDVIGYGELTLKEPVGDWTMFEIPVEYTATDIVPTHLVIICSASRWGDYFVGSEQNRMWVDDFELLWD